MQAIDNLRNIMAAEHIETLILAKTDDFVFSASAPIRDYPLHVMGFSASMATLVITMDKALIFVDGRYVLQAQQQLASQGIQVIPTSEQSLLSWLTIQKPCIKKLSFDPWVHSGQAVKKWEELGFDLHALNESTLCKFFPDIDSTPPTTSIIDYPHGGQSRQNKIKQLCNLLKQRNHDGQLLLAPESICWLLNIRGWDNDNTPIIFSRALLLASERLLWFIPPERIPATLKSVLENEIDITILEPNAWDETLPEVLSSDLRLSVDQNAMCWAIQESLTNNNILYQHDSDVSLIPKAIKNQTEINAIKQSHIQDGIALCRFFCWLEQQDLTAKPLYEQDIVKAIADFRAHCPDFQRPSFDTIAAAGDNAALIHYHPSKESNKQLLPGQMLLLDSGGQYFTGGTTDVTRTVFLGPSPISSDYKHYFTLVLQGMIRVSMTPFPDKTPGCVFEGLARTALWQNYQDYQHSTGHGVGAYLHVHEAPNGISLGNLTKLQPGMLLSVEPGYYRDHEFGIRIENLVLAEHTEHTGYCRFETVTLCPIETNLIDLSLLSKTELQWLNTYHQRVREVILPHLHDAKEQQWLINKTSAL